MCQHTLWGTFPLSLITLQNHEAPCLRIFTNACGSIMISHMPKRSSAFKPLVSPEQLLTHPNLFIYGQVSSMYHLRSSAPPSLTLRMLRACIYSFPGFKTFVNIHKLVPKWKKPTSSDGFSNRPKSQKVGFSYCLASLFFALCFNCSLDTLFFVPKNVCKLGCFLFFCAALAA